MSKHSRRKTARARRIWQPNVYNPDAKMVKDVHTKSTPDVCRRQTAKEMSR
jgi:hypothetical protein